MKYLPSIFCMLIFFSTNAQSNQIQTADSLAAVGQHSEAIELLENIEPKSDKIYLKLAQFQKSQEQNEAALENYQKVLIKNPDLVLTAQDYGELLLETGNLKKADSVFTGLNEKYPDNAGFTYRLGLVKEKQKDSTAMKYFFRTVAKDGTHQAALYKTAKYFLQNRKSYNAISICKDGLEARPNNTSLLSILGQAYMRTLQFEEAIEPFERLVELGEDSEFILEKLAKAYRTTGQTEKAISTYQQMLEINDANATVHSNLGALYLKQNDAEKAKVHFTMALLIKKQPVDAEYVNIGISFKRLEQYEEAYQNFQKALKENPDNERALIELALVADAKMDDKKSILKHYERYVEKYSENGRKDMLSVAEYRISELKSEIHMAE